MKNTKTLTLSALMAALCVVIMSLGSLIESLDFSVSLLAGLLIMILSSEYGDRVAMGVWAVAGIIALLLPMKTPAVFFLSFFGWYPVVQKKINMLPLLFSRVVKILLFNGVMGLLLVLSAFLTGATDALWLYAVYVGLANFCFQIYDVLLDRFLIWYILKLRHRFRF